MQMDDQNKELAGLNLIELHALYGFENRIGINLDTASAEWLGERCNTIAYTLDRNRLPWSTFAAKGYATVVERTLLVERNDPRVECLTAMKHTEGDGPLTLYNDLTVMEVLPKICANDEVLFTALGKLRLLAKCRPIEGLIELVGLYSNTPLFELTKSEAIQLFMDILRHRFSDKLCKLGPDGNLWEFTGLELCAFAIDIAVSLDVLNGGEVMG